MTLKAEVHATIQCPTGDEDTHACINKFPFYIGQAPAFASNERSAVCVVANMYVFKKPLEEFEMRQLPTRTSLKGLLSLLLLLWSIIFAKQFTLLIRADKDIFCISSPFSFLHRLKKGRTEPHIQN